MDYEIIATLGPSSAVPESWRALLNAGATAFRLNTSHIGMDELLDWLARLDDFQRQRQETVPVVLDLQGSKWRLGDFPPCSLQAGQVVRLTLAEVLADGIGLPVPHADFFRAASSSGGEVRLNDGTIQLKIESTEVESLTARVLQGGVISSRKSLVIPASSYRQERLSAKDQAILEQTRGLDGLQYALSYVKDALEMQNYRRFFGRSAHLIAKLERQPAVSQAGDVARFANEIWLCRGDLGAELGLPAMAVAVADFSSRVGVLAIPTLLAGQLFEHMKVSRTPTRSEVCYLYDTLQRGYRGVVLSDETAIGNYPVESCAAAAMFR